ncbi:MAG: substrate-binding domain-containing protein [Gemmatimonadetes bacterium]|nr:substrate-binding domain-containing protein [Gemmatimonadota bacterium]
MGGWPGRWHGGLAVLVAGWAAACSGGASRDRSPVVLAATTTVEDSGLLPVLLEAFERAYPAYRIRAVTVGTGQALALARRGDVDVVFSHDPRAESLFVAAGHGAYRREVMRSRFLIAGPASDPAGIRGLEDAAGALQRIAAAGAPFVSRADDSGTNRKELELWRAGGAAGPTGAGNGGRGDWYLEAGAGMAEALDLANQRGAYILTEAATYLTVQARLELVVLVRDDARLLNRYGVTRVRQAAHGAGADALAAWLVSDVAQQLIGRFGADRFGAPLFSPAAVR